MKAAWYSETGPAQVLKTGYQPDSIPETGEVRVRVHVSGVNPSDVKARAGSRGPMAFSFQIPHSDGAGVIEAVGAGVAAARVGERVYLWNAAWNRQFGSCSDTICLPSAQAVALPENSDYTLGACIGIPVMTACHAMMADGAVTHKTVLVNGGAGTVGRFAIQLAKWNGARVITTVSSDTKASVAHAAGADLVINYKIDDVIERVKEFTKGQGVDSVVEVEFGGNLGITTQIIKRGGVVAAYGSMANRTPALPFYELMFKHVTLRMLLVYGLSDSERLAVCAWINDALKAGALTPLISKRFALDEVVEAHKAVESGSLIGNALIDLA